MKNIIFIGGMGRSGSTVLESIVQQRISAVGVGEVKFVWFRGQIRNELCGCGEEFHRCRFWQQIIPEVLGHFQTNAAEVEGLRRSIERYHKHFLFRTLGFKSARYEADLARYRSIYGLLYRRLFEASGTNVLIDSSKDPIHIAAMSELKDFKPHLIQLIRDPRAVAYSLLTPKKRKEVHWTTEEMRVLPPLRTALIWNFINFATDELRKEIGSSLLLRYEDFVQDQSELECYLDKIVDGVPAEQPRQWHSVSGNPHRFENRRLELKEDRRWVDNLSVSDRLLVELVTAPLMKRYGYRFGAPDAHTFGSGV